MLNKNVLEILNEMEVFESNGGSEPYALVKVNGESKELLKEASIPLETALKYGDDETFCVLTLAFSEGFANSWTGEELEIIDERTTKELKNEIQVILDSPLSDFKELHSAITDTLNSF